MPSATSIHDWLRPLLERLVQDGVARGADPQAVVATMIDLAGSEDFAAVPPASSPPPAPPRD